MQMNANKYTLSYICLCKYSCGPCKSLTRLQAAAYDFLVRTLGRVPGVNDRWYHDLSEQTSLLANSSQKSPRKLLTEPSFVSQIPFLTCSGLGAHSRPQLSVGAPRPAESGDLATARGLIAAGGQVRLPSQIAFNSVPGCVGWPVAGHSTSLRQGAPVCCVPDQILQLTYMHPVGDAGLEKKTSPVR